MEESTPLESLLTNCVEASIRREFVVPYNAQQNGVVERKNRSLVGAAKAMLHDQGLPLFL